MGASDQVIPSLAIDERLLLAAAYHADRVSKAANNLAGWALEYVQNEGTRDAKSISAVEFAEGAITFAASVVWNELELIGRGGWISRAKLGLAKALELAQSMPEVYARGENVLSRKPLTLDDADVIARKYATLTTARRCLEVCETIPELFNGPEGSTRLARARLEWRAVHNVADPPPMSPDEQLRIALQAADPQPVGITPYEALIETLRKRRARTQAALLEVMRDTSSLPVETIAHDVHGDDETTGDAIKANVKRTNLALEEHGLPIRFRVASGWVFKEQHPE
jgi:hypothetical protein